VRVLLRPGERFALQLIGLSNGSLKPGTVYITLSRMESKGCVLSRSEDRLPNAKGLPRRWYRSTAYGRRVRKAWALAARAFAEADLHTGAA
jgi:DNA-binding PadR family transcriptional regulator